MNFNSHWTRVEICNRLNVYLMKSWTGNSKSSKEELCFSLNSKILLCPLINKKLCVIFNIILFVCGIGTGTRPPPGTWKAWNLDSLQGRSTEQESGVNKLAITANNIDAGLGNYTVTQGTQNKYTIVSPDNPSHINISHRFGLIMLPYVRMPKDFIRVQYSVTCTFQTNMRFC